MEIRGKVALVTGAASGIGRATALALADAGARVAVADVDAKGGAESVRQVRAAGGEAEFILADVGSPAGVAALLAATLATFGRIDIAHNNAGIMTGDTPGWPLASPERIAAVIAINTTGVILGTRAAIAAMRERGGVVVNTASIAGLGPLPNDPVYAATKAAVIHFTRSCATLPGVDNVRVCAVAPGMVDTPIIAKTGDGIRPAPWLEPFLATTKLIRPEEIAAAVLELVRDDTLRGEVRVVNPA